MQAATAAAENTLAPDQNRQLSIAVRRFGFEAEIAQSSSTRVRRLTPLLRNGHGIGVRFLQGWGTSRPLRLPPSFSCRLSRDKHALD
jgi:hypothetical protein